MNNSPKKITKIQLRPLFTCPDMGEVLPDYVVELLSDSASEAVEEHLPLCRQCREDYLKVSSIQGAAREKRMAAAASEQHTRASADIIRMADFKK